MAIAFDSFNQASQAAATSQTLSHTGTGSNLASVVVVLGSATVDDLLDCTYAGSSMTKLQTLAPGAVQNRYVYLFYLSGVTSGAQDVVATATNASIVRVHCATYSGVTAGARDATNTKGDTAGTTSPTISVTTVADNCWATAFFSAACGGTFSDGTNYTERSGSAGADRGFGDTNSAQTPAGSKALTATNSSADDYGAVVVSFAPAAVVATTNNFLLMGTK